MKSNFLSYPYYIANLKYINYILKYTVDKFKGNKEMNILKAIREL